MFNPRRFPDIGLNCVWNVLVSSMLNIQSFTSVYYASPKWKPTYISLWDLDAGDAIRQYAVYHLNS